MKNGLDLVPDEMEWRDEGCELFPRCLDCPLPRCVEEVPRFRRRLKTAVRDRKMVELKAAGRGVKEIARQFGVSERTVRRALGRDRGRRNDQRL